METQIKPAILYADSARGIYVPQYVAQSINRERVKYVSQEDWQILESGPDHEHYWETWDSFLAMAETDDGGIFYQDGDLWIIYADSARESVNQYCESMLEYEESHNDAGENYAHMPRESWTSNDDSSLRAYLVAQDIDSCGLELEDIAEIVLDNFQMYTGSIWGAYDLDDSAFILAAYPIQEIEIDLNGLGIDDVTLEYIKDSCDPYINDSGLAYLTTDSVWFAAIERDTLQGLIRDHAETR